MVFLFLNINVGQDMFDPRQMNIDEMFGPFRVQPLVFHSSIAVAVCVRSIANIMKKCGASTENGNG